MSYERFHRDDPERTEPFRSFSNTFQSAGGGWTEVPGWIADSAAAEAADPSRSVPAEDPVSRGVRQGYDLLGKQIALGQQAAQNMGATFCPPGTRQDFAQMLRAWSTAYVDTMKVWFDLFCPVTLPVDPGQLPFAVSISSARYTRFQVHVQPNLGGVPLHIQPLRAKDATLPPLMDVAFGTDARGHVLRLQVPDNQPPAAYFGEICTQAGLPVGSVAFEILQP
jgi:hypothetical protein